MNTEEFCSLQENRGSLYCESATFLGPIPPQYDFLHGVFFCVFIVCAIMVIFSFFFIFNAFLDGMRD